MSLWRKVLTEEKVEKTIFRITSYAAKLLETSIFREIYLQASANGGLCQKAF